MTGVACLVLGIVFGYVWQPIQSAIDLAGNWLTTAGALGTFVFGVLNRILLVTGLHHIINSLAWFVFGSFTPPAGGEVVHGDLHRFFAGDPTAGGFMTGFFPIMMFGLPAACLAMFHEALKERRAVVGGLLFSMALTAFLTSVTEPMLFSPERRPNRFGDSSDLCAERAYFTRQASSPSVIKSFGNSMPMNTILLFFFSAGAHLPARSLPII